MAISTQADAISLVDRSSANLICKSAPAATAWRQING